MDRALVLFAIAISFGMAGNTGTQIGQRGPGLAAEPIKPLDREAHLIEFEPQDATAGLAQQFGADVDLADFRPPKARFQLHVPDDAVRLQHHVISTPVDLTFQHLDIARPTLPHEGEQLAKEHVAQRLLAQAGIGRMRRDLKLGWTWLGISGRLGHALYAQSGLSALAKGDRRMMSRGDDNEDGGGGYGRPPRTTRFTKGQSGNPAGRPRGRRREAPYEAVLGQMVTIREGGVERRVTAAEAFLLQLTKRGLEGDSAATRASLTAIEKVRERPGTHQGPSVIIRTIVAPGSVTSALEALRMARKLDPYRETARMALEPWLVEAALGLCRTLSPADQRTIVKATRTPHQVRWPEWWGEHP